MIFNMEMLNRFITKMLPLFLDSSRRNGINSLSSSLIISSIPDFPKPNSFNVFKVKRLCSVHVLSDLRKKTHLKIKHTIFFLKLWFNFPIFSLFSSQNIRAKNMYLIILISALEANMKTEGIFYGNIKNNDHYVMPCFNTSKDK